MNQNIQAFFSFHWYDFAQYKMLLQHRISSKFFSKSAHSTLLVLCECKLFKELQSFVGCLKTTHTSWHSKRNVYPHWSFVKWLNFRKQSASHLRTCSKFIILIPSTCMLNPINGAQLQSKQDISFLRAQQQRGLVLGEGENFVFDAHRSDCYGCCRLQFELVYVTHRPTTKKHTQVYMCMSMCVCARGHLCAPGHKCQINIIHLTGQRQTGKL